MESRSDDYRRFTLSELIDWLHTMPADREYLTVDPQFCMAAEFLRAHGVAEPRVGFNSYTMRGDDPYGPVRYVIAGEDHEEMGVDWFDWRGSSTMHWVISGILPMDQPRNLRVLDGLKWEHTYGDALRRAEFLWDSRLLDA